MSYFSNGVIKAATHRVKNTNSIKRYSWPFFVDPTWDVSLSKIPIFNANSSYANISPEKENFQIKKTRDSSRKSKSINTTRNIKKELI